MKKVIFFIGLLVKINSVCFGQGYTNHWVMGYHTNWGIPWGGTNIDFIGNSLSIYYVPRVMSFDFTNAIISDSTGNLLFYSNGLWVANALGNQMPNGFGLNPGTFTNNWPDGLPIQQGQIAIPLPGDTGRYYLFHETCTYANGLLKPFELFYSIIDMSLSGGMGDVISKNIIVLQDTLFWGELNATRHANGRDWWLLLHRVNSDKYYKLLISANGISVYSQNIGIFRDLHGGGAADFSPDGFKFSYYSPTVGLEIFDFDRCTGMLSSHINIPINDSANFGSVAFSANSKVLYVSSMNYVYQFDVTAANVASTKQTVAVYDGFYSPSPPFATSFLMAELGPDNKIYINCGNGTLDIHKINFPDSLGLACDVQQHSVHLATYNAFTIPNHPNYFLGSIPGSPCDSLTTVAEINSNTIPIRINPNPAQNTFYLNYELPYGQNATATIYNSLGQAVMKKSLYWYFGYLQVDCSGLTNGVYTIKVEGKERMGTAKVVVSR